MKEEPAMDLLPLFQEAHAAVTGHEAKPLPWLSMYAYVATTSTIRERDGRLIVRVSDHLRDAPADALRGLFASLVCRLRGWSEKRVPAAWAAAYARYVGSDDMDARRTASRSRRGRKALEPVGDHRSLLESYLRVALETGLVLPSAPRLSWSPTASRSRFGHQDDAHDCIVISRILDDPAVPDFVLDYVVYHELLHIAHPPVRGSGSKRIIHHRAFREAERRFSRRNEAERWLQRLARDEVPARRA